MQSLDDVIDALIVDRVVHRHRRVWLAGLAVVAAVLGVITLTGGWKEHRGREVDTLQAPVTVQAGRFEYRFTTAAVVRTPRTEDRPAEARLEVSFDLRNVDEETKASAVLSGGLLRLSPGPGRELVESDGATCHGQLNVVIVPGLPAQPCFARFAVPADFTADTVELALFAERYDADDTLLGASDEAYWHSGGVVQSAVRVPATVRTEATR